MNIIFVCQYDPLGNRVGGIGNYINNFIRYAPDDVTFKIIGISAGKHLHRRWSEISIYDKKVQFLPLVKVSDINKKDKIPLALVFTLRLFLTQKEINAEDIIFCQRSEYIYPFYLRKNILLSIIHNDITLELNRNSSENNWAKFPRLYLLFLRIAFNRANHIFSVNHNSIAFVCSKINLSSTKISFAHTWADPQLFIQIPPNQRDTMGKSLAQKLNIDDQRIRLLFVGRFQKQKNIPLLLNAYLAVKDRCVLLMAGTGADYDYVSDFIKKNALESDIKLLGNVAHSQIPELMASCHIYISSSHFEGMSIALMEALSAGLYVVTTNTGEAKHLLIEGKSGNIAKNFDVNAFVEAINTALQTIKAANFTFAFDINQYSPEKSIAIVLNKARELSKHH